MENFVELLPQTLVNGLTLGSVYALIALGYTMVYGILKLLNFAHGDVYMVGAYLGYGVIVLLVPQTGPLIPTGFIILIMFVVAMSGSTILGVLIERFAYRPLRNAPRVAPLISALGVSFFLQTMVQLTVGARPIDYRSSALIASGTGVWLGGFFIEAARVMVVVLTVVLMIILTYFVRSTRLGRGIRAVSMDSQAAEMMGVDVNKVVLVTFIVGSALAGAAGVMVGLVFLIIRHTMGFVAGLRGFTASVVGGIGSIPGAVVGGLIIGLAEAFASVYISATFKEIITFMILIAVLLIRPTGLLGASVEEKV